jgi:hypothetical protein
VKVGASRMEMGVYHELGALIARKSTFQKEENE